MHHGFTSLSGILGMVKATLSSSYEDRGALDLLNQPIGEHGRGRWYRFALRRARNWKSRAYDRRGGKHRRFRPKKSLPVLNMNNSRAGFRRLRMKTMCV